MAGVVLAAGEGRRLRPLTLLAPKPLCPVGGRPLLDGVLARAGAAAADLAVNVHHGRARLEAHLAGDHPEVHVSIEEERPLGTAGALGALRDWLAGRGALVVNGDGWSLAELGSFVDGWDRERVRLLVAGEQADLHPGTLVVASLVPAAELARFDAVPSGLYENCWRPAQLAGRLELCTTSAPFVDCGTPASYLRANLWAARLAGGSILDPSAEVSGSVERSVVGAGARVEGGVRDSVLWPGVEVARAERLVGVVRAGPRTTVAVR